MTRSFPAGEAVGKGRRPTSFSLVEVIVAIAILSIILIVLLGMTTSLMSTWQLSHAKNERRTLGQAVLDRMSRDLRQVALPSSRSNTNNLQFVINPPGLSASYEFPQAIFLAGARRHRRRNQRQPRRRRLFRPMDHQWNVLLALPLPRPHQSFVGDRLQHLFQPRELDQAPASFPTTLRHRRLRLCRPPC